MDIQSTLNTPSSSSTSPSASSQTAQTVLGKEDFLRLLVTQLEYQDPMNPMSNEDFIAQTAQFSSLEQMQNLNKSMEELMGLERSMENALLAGHVGKTVEVPGSNIRLRDEGAVLGVALKEPARIHLEIRDESGALVRTLGTDEILPPDDYRFIWDGTDEDGSALPHGMYHVTTVAFDLTEEPVAAQPFVRGQVEAVLYRDHETTFVVNGEEIQPTDVRAVEAQ